MSEFVKSGIRFRKGDFSMGTNREQTGKPAREQPVKNGTKQVVNAVKEALLTALFPYVCPVCNQVIDRNIDWIHPECRRFLTPIKGRYCIKCGKSLKEEGELCTDCAGTEHVFIQNAAAFARNEVSKRAIYAFKYENKREFGYCFAKGIEENCKERISKWDIDAIVPVPLYIEKKRIRGFNQTELLADSLGDLLGMTVVKNALIRTRKTAPMKDLSGGERFRNVAGAFVANTENCQQIKGKRLLVLDDIYTTGTTLDACAQVLLEAGAEAVYGVTLCVGEGF